MYTQLAISLVLYLFGCFGIMKVFEKVGGMPAWAAFIPIYNFYLVTVNVAKKEIVWFILLLIPCLNLVGLVIIGIAVAEKFGKSALYGVGLGLLWFIFYPILGLSDARYEGGGRGRSLDEDEKW
jgi:hypothetical protein